MEKTTPLNQNHIFRRLYRSGKSAVTPHVVVYIKKNGKKHNRLGITATKKIGGAVQRNRARRVIKEAYRISENELPAGFDIVVVARAKASLAPMQAVQKSLLKAFEALPTGYVRK